MLRITQNAPASRIFGEVAAALRTVVEESEYYKVFGTRDELVQLARETGQTPSFDYADRKMQQHVTSRLTLSLPREGLASRGVESYRDSGMLVVWDARRLGLGLPKLSDSDRNLWMLTGAFLAPEMLPEQRAGA